MKYIDGRLLKEMLISCANNLYNNYPSIDALNVFPVPDGDTGMNMNLTLQSGVKEIANRNDEDATSIATAFSKGLLMGARGNSGVITSQIFRGFASSVKGLTKLSSVDIATAFSNGSKTAYKAVMRPVEGTILTVIRESSEAVEKVVTEDYSVEDVFKLLLKEAKASLKRTPDLLPILKEAGVVDSGGAGLIKIIEGLYSALKGKFIEKDEDTSAKEADGEDAVYYKVNYILRVGTSEAKRPFTETAFIKSLGRFGKDIQLNKRDNALIEIEILTLNPGGVLTYSQLFGEFANIRIVNTCERFLLTEEEAKAPELDEFAIVSVCAGSGIEDLFKSFGVKEIVSGGQTMNPSIEDIANAVKNCNAKTVFVLPNNSNIVMAATQAADIIEGINVLVVPTKTIPQGMSACQAFNPDLDGPKNYEEMKKAVKAVKSGSVTYAIKDTVIDGVEVRKDEFMGIEGKAIKICTPNKFDALYELVSSMVDDESYLITVLTGEDISQSEYEELEATLQDKYPEVDVAVQCGNQPVYSFLVGVE
ncbi:MAG: DAK2 domain-containing protein [Bacilli bacterium]|nr:DAK2 domain-containing protein [Bacilli bacterium]